MHYYCEFGWNVNYILKNKKITRLLILNEGIYNTLFKSHNDYLDNYIHLH